VAINGRSVGENGYAMSMSCVYLSIHISQYLTHRRSVLKVPVPFLDLWPAFNDLPGRFTYALNSEATLVLKKSPPREIVASPQTLEYLDNIDPCTV